MSARITNVVLGAWLFVSAFIWTHSDAQFTNTWICGLLAAGFAAIAMRVEPARFLNTALSIWLFISAFALPALAVATVWNNALVAIAIFVVSLIPNEAGERRGLRYRRRTQLPA